jgi:hypothetical protein
VENLNTSSTGPKISVCAISCCGSASTMTVGSTKFLAREVSAGPVAAEHDPAGVVAPGPVEHSADALDGGRVDQRSHLDLGVERVAHLVGRGGGGDELDHVVVDVVMHDETGRHDAALTGEHPDAVPDRAFRHVSQVAGVGEHDAAGLPAEFEHGGLELLRARVHDLPGGGRAAGEADLLYLRVADERRTRFGAAQAALRGGVGLGARLVGARSPEARRRAGDHDGAAAAAGADRREHHLDGAPYAGQVDVDDVAPGAVAVTVR